MEVYFAFVGRLVTFLRENVAQLDAGDWSWCILILKEFVELFDIMVDEFLKQ